jgi:hypothetical protein
MVYYLEIVLYHTQLISHTNFAECKWMGLYNGTISRFECCTIASLKVRAKCRSLYVCYKHIPMNLLKQTHSVDSFA